MKRILYNIIICCAAMLSFVACNKVDDITDGFDRGKGNNIILNMSSGTLPLSRAVVAKGAEIAVSHIDVLIFGQDGMKLWHERVGSSGNSSDRIVLSAPKNRFNTNEQYWVYLIANSTHPETDFSGLTDLNGLKAMTQQDENIHMTGLPNLTGMPQTFLMDGVAYPDNTNEPNTAAPVVLNNGIQSDDTKLKVTLRRAAAKIVVKIKKGEYVTFDNSPTSHNAGYYLQNMPYSTSVLTGVDAPADLRTPPQNNGGYFTWTDDLITVTAYTYSHEWKNESVLEKEVRLVVNLPLIYRDPNDPNAEETLRPSNYYQIPVSQSKILNRNCYYEVTVTVNTPGAENPSKPIELNNVTYSVQPWDETTINVGDESSHPVYLTVNEEEMAMYNMEDDTTTLHFASSSEVDVKITKVYYIDKFGQEESITANSAGITVIPSSGLTGNIKIHSPIPENNTIRYIELEVTNRDDATPRHVTIAQYPLEYITNIQGWYSYRDDFGGTTLEDYGQRGTTNNSLFDSKVATEITSGKNKGQSTIYRYTWRRGTLNEHASTMYNPGNARMYKVVISSTSKEYTLGIPRLNANGYTEESAANNKLVSPSFMLASQLGALSGTTEDYNTAAKHCEQYVEVYKDKKTGKTIRLTDWRLPTRAELEIIIKFQYKSDAMDEVIRRQGYWCADKEYVYNTQGASGNGYVRCIRDAYGNDAADN